jgi:hypothetical protein
MLTTNADHAWRGRVFGYFYLLGFTLSSLSSVIFAYVIETLGINYIAGVSLLSVVPALFIRETQKLSP